MSDTPCIILQQGHLLGALRTMAGVSELLDLDGRANTKQTNDSIDCTVLDQSSNKRGLNGASDSASGKGSALVSTPVLLGIGSIVLITTVAVAALVSSSSDNTQRNTGVITSGQFSLHNTQTSAQDTFMSQTQGDYLELPYTVSTTGTLVVATGMGGSNAMSPTTVEFVTSTGTTTLVATTDQGATGGTQGGVGVQLHLTPVTVGQSGTIQVTWCCGMWATNRRGIIATVVTGASTVQWSNSYTIADNPLITASAPISGDSLVLTTMASDANTDLVPYGSGHQMVAMPFTPITLFHSTRFALGFAPVNGTGTHVVGYENNNGDFLTAVMGVVVLV